MKEEKEGVFSPKGEKLSKDEIKEYMTIKKILIRQMRRSPNFYKQLETGDLSEYYAVLEELKLKDENGNKLDDKDIYEILGIEQVNNEELEEKEER